MDEDDLPPKPLKKSDEATASGELGFIFGALMWIVIFFVICGVALYALRHWLG